MLTSLGYECSPAGVREVLQGFCDELVCDVQDGGAFPTVMRTREDRAELARKLLFRPAC
jgi:hypothetical protein